METFKIIKMIPYLKQTNLWEKYLNSIGWKSFRLKNSTLVVYRITPIGNFGKIQRPVNLSNEDFIEIEFLCKSHKISFLKIEPALSQNLDVLITNNFTTSNIPLGPTCTMEIDLTLSEKTLWSNLSTSGKYGVNRGKKNGSRIEFIKNPSEELLLNYFKTVQCFTSKDKGFHSLSWKELSAVYKAFKNNTYLSLGYDSNNNLAGGKFYLINNTTVFYLTGGTTEIGKHTRVGFVQMWESILFFKNLGYKTLDLDGMYDSRFPNHRKSWIGFSKFKEKFGGNVIQYPKPYIKYYSKILLYLNNILPMNM